MARIGHALLLQLTDDDALGGDGRMVGPGQPQNLAASHALVARHEIFHRQHYGMAGVQRARGVGRRHGDGEGFLVRVRVGYEGSGHFPAPVNVGFELGGLKILVELRTGHDVLSGVE